ncbi:MAG: aminodeoxychorismate/anthranilate synthase component II [Candidatus Omnitrophota bacterium]
MYLLIDNYDSFTYNLYQAFAENGVRLLVKRNDEITLSDIEELRPDKMIISPGPRTPAEAGISVDVVRRFGGRIPILGICLGHQCITSAFGGRICRVEKIVHGKTSPVSHDGTGIFSGVPSPFNAARYHSLQTADIPACFDITARTENIVMAVRHKEFPITGLQFHPESFLTEHGRKMISNFIGP